MSNKNTSKSKAILLKGFGFLTILIFLMAGAWFFMTFDNQDRIEHILKEQTEMRAIFAMRDAALQRAIILHRMALLEDEFERDDEYIKLKEQAGKFIKAREIFLQEESRRANATILNLWEQAAVNIRKAADIQQQVTDLILNDDIVHANELLLNEAIPIQRRVMATLTKLLDIQREKMEKEVSGIYQQNTIGLIFVSIIASWAIFWGISIARTTIRRISQTERSLDAARHKALEADQQKSRFLANMSHEIRTPLTAIIGYSETLIEDNRSATDWKKYVSSIVRNGKHLHQLINDILDLSKIEANQLSIETIPISICELMSEVESLMGERARNKGLSFTLNCQFPIPNVINNDPTRLKQILLNLCSNAIKFTAEGGITLGVAFEPEKEVIRFTIKDTGIGMSEDQMAELFKPFKQADTSTTRKFGGTGLGLYISKQLAEQLGGELESSSQVGIGSAFIVSIKANLKDDVEWIKSAPEAEKLGRRAQSEIIIPTLEGKVLLAEDNADNQALISMHIKKTGAEIEVVENGQQAVEAALEKEFDLILMDMQMPVMGGIEAIRIIRERGCSTPIATLTANAMKEDIQASQAAGADDFMTKPIERKVFYSVLVHHLAPALNRHRRENGAITDRKPGDISDLVDKYIAQLPESCSRIQQYIKAREWEAVKDEIHQLKGTGGAFGFPGITDQCIDIEHQLLSKNYAAAERLINQLARHCDEIVERHSFSLLTANNPY